MGVGANAALFSGWGPELMLTSTILTSIALTVVSVLGVITNGNRPHCYLYNLFLILKIKTNLSLLALRSGAIFY